MDDLREAWKKVEQLQEELHDIVRKKGLNSAEAISVSQVFRNKMKEYNDLKTGGSR